MFVLLQNVLFKTLYIHVYVSLLVYNLIITYECLFVKCFVHLFQIIFTVRK